MLKIRYNKFTHTQTDLKGVCPVYTVSKLGKVKLFVCGIKAITFKNFNFLISNFRRVLNPVCILLGNSPAFDCCMPTFRNTLSVPSSQAGYQTPGKYPKEYIQDSKHGESLKSRIQKAVSKCINLRFTKGICTHLPISCG